MDLVARGRRHRGHHVGRIQAPVDVLAAQLLLGTVGHGLVEGAAFVQADFTQSLAQHFFGEFLVARELDGRDAGALLHHDHQHVAVDFKAHVREQAQRKQRTDGAGAFFVVVGVAHLHGHGREHRARLDALQAFHPDVAHGEWINRPGRLSGKQHGNDCGSRTASESFHR